MKALSLLQLALLAFVSSASANEALDAVFPQSSIVISASSSACYRFDVYLALDDEQRRRGLMHVRDLHDWRGMLFVYGQDAVHSMWMKNTFISLDMLFVRADGSIASIAKNTEPQSLRSIGSGVSVRYVLELNAGITDKLDIAVGDRLSWAGDITPLQD